MPPAPSSRMISYGPIRVPFGRVMQSAKLGASGRISQPERAPPSADGGSIGSVEANEAAAGGDAHRFGAARDAQLLEQVSEVRLHGPLGDRERRGDFLVAVPVGEQPQRGELPRRELHLG